MAHFCSPLLGGRGATAALCVTAMSVTCQRETNPGEGKETTYRREWKERKYRRVERNKSRNSRANFRCRLNMLEELFHQGLHNPFTLLRPLVVDFQVDAAVGHVHDRMLVAVPGKWEHDRGNVGVTGPDEIEDPVPQGVAEGRIEVSGDDCACIMERPVENGVVRVVFVDGAQIGRRAGPVEVVLRHVLVAFRLVAPRVRAVQNVRVDVHPGVDGRRRGVGLGLRQRLPQEVL